MDAESKSILVLGGTGHYGRHIVMSLLGKGAKWLSAHNP